MSQDNIKCLNGIQWNLSSMTFQCFFKGKETDLTHKLDADIEASVTSFTWQSDLQLHLTTNKQQKKTT